MLCLGGDKAIDKGSPLSFLLESLLLPYNQGMLGIVAEDLFSHYRWLDSRMASAIAAHVS